MRKNRMILMVIALLEGMLVAKRKFERIGSRSNCPVGGHEDSCVVILTAGARSLTSCDYNAKHRCSLAKVRSARQKPSLLSGVRLYLTEHAMKFQ